MTRITTTSSYLQSLLWTALFMALMNGETNMVELLFVDFIRGNPHRTQANAIFMMTVYTPTFGVIAFVGTIVVFALSQFFQAELVGAFERAVGDRARFTPLVALPATAILTWYCYDYLTPSNLCCAGNCMEPYEHGISVSRYL